MSQMNTIKIFIILIKYKFFLIMAIYFLVIGKINKSLIMTLQNTLALVLIII